MLNTPTAFPLPGSFGVFADPAVPIESRRAELVRITRRWADHDGEQAFVTFPLRSGSSGSRTLALADVLDGTPLTQAEERELADLDRALQGRPVRSKAQRQRLARRDALKARLVWSRSLSAELAKLDKVRAQGTSAARRGRTVSFGQIVDTRANAGARAFTPGFVA